MEENLTGNGTEFPENEAQALNEESEEDEKARKAAEKAVKRQETARKVKKFLVENKDVLILAGQLTLVTIVCIAGIKNDIMPDCCRKKKRRKKRR